MTVDERVLGIYATFLNQIIPGRVGVLVHLDLRRKFAATLTVAAVVDCKQSKPQPVKQRDSVKIASDVQIIAVEVEDGRGRRVC